MGTETNGADLYSYLQDKQLVKLNNPLMGTETQRNFVSKDGMHVFG